MAALLHSRGLRGHGVVSLGPEQSRGSSQRHVSWAIVTAQHVAGMAWCCGACRTCAKMVFTGKKSSSRKAVMQGVVVVHAVSCFVVAAKGIFWRKRVRERMWTIDIVGGGV